LPIIAMTAHAMRGDLERCLAADRDGYIPKPIRVQELIALLERYSGVCANLEVAPIEDAHAERRANDTLRKRSLPRFKNSGVRSQEDNGNAG
jgi:CheY-like chemotaxis protein